MQRGFYLMLGVCWDYRNTLLFQTQLWKAKVCECVEQSDFLEVKTSSSKTHPKPYIASLCSPVCWLQLLLQSKALVPQEAVAKQRPRDKQD